MNTNQESPSKVGWTDQPNGRGTLDIIWTSIFTMFLCSWSVLYLNVSGPCDSTVDIFVRKLWNTLLCLLGPEFSMLTALGQWQSASESVIEFQNSGYQGWTIVHAFFADMGGFILHSPDYKPFPVNAKQVHYLVCRDYINFPSIDKRSIIDKNKSDGFLRILTLCQALWFIVNITGRASQNLAITGLELTTAAFVVCTIVTCFCWSHKPADLTVSEIIHTKTSISIILHHAGHNVHKNYRETPLDFISRKEWHWSLYWSNWLNICRHMGFKFVQVIKPVDRFANTNTTELKGWRLALFYATNLVYTGIFIFGWNFDFPTEIEQTLWRVASITMFSTNLWYFLITKYVFTVHPALRRRYGNHLSYSEDSNNNIERRRWVICDRLSQIAEAVAATIRNNSIDKDPELTVPLKAIVPMYLLGFVYCVARSYIFIADAIELRYLPISAYKSVEWSSVLPHL